MLLTKLSALVHVHVPDRKDRAVSLFLQGFAHPVPRQVLRRVQIHALFLQHRLGPEGRSRDGTCWASLTKLGAAIQSDAG